MRKLRASTQSGRRGLILPLAALLMIVLVALVAFGVDIGWMVLGRTQLQSAADAGAMAGADALRNSSQAATAAAERLAEKHQAVGRTVDVRGTEDIELGAWDSEARVFTILGGSAEQANAVRLTCRASSARGTGARLFFAGMLGQRNVDLSASAVAQVRRAQCGRIVGIDLLSLQGGLTDSYDSRLGTYASQSPRSGGHVCSNGAVEIRPEQIVRGNATCGSGLEVIVGPNAQVTGRLQSNEERIPFPSIDPGDAASTNDNSQIPSQYLDGSGSLKVAGSEPFNLLPGTYYLRGDLDISGSGGLQVTGPTTIYVEGSISITGSGLTNTSQLPSNLQLLLLGDNAKLAGSAALHAKVYGPAADIVVTGSGGLFGSVIGKTLTGHGNAAIHYDEALDNDPRNTPISVSLVK